MARIVVTKLDGYDFDTSVDDIIERMNNLKAEYPNKKLCVDFYMEQIQYSNDERTVFEVFYIDNV